MTDPPDFPTPKAVGRPFVPPNPRAVFVLATIVFALPLFFRNDYLLLLFNVMALNALVVLGLNLLIGSTGQVSLGHAAFYGLGAYLSAIASTSWHWPLLGALVFAVIIVGLVGFLLAVPTLRLEGHYLVMATLGFNVIVNILLVQMEPLTGGPSGFPGIPRLHIGSYAVTGDRAFYFIIWTVFLIAFAMTLNLSRSRIGRAFQAVHERELTARALGIPSHRLKVTAFVLSTLYAGLAGFFYAHYVTFISPKTFDIFYSVQIVTMVAVGGMGSLWGGLAGTILLTALPEVLHHFEDLHVLFYGLILMGVLVFTPNGLIPSLTALPFVVKLRRFGKTDPDFRTESAPSSRVWNAHPLPIDELPPDFDRSSPLLGVNGVSLSFGGLQALSDVSFSVYPGEIVALIGPNGAGKTTLLNVVSGLVKPQSGTLTLRGIDISGFAPYILAARGIGRTFQSAQVFKHFNTLENVLLGFHVSGHAGLTGALLHTPSERREEERLTLRAMEMLDRFGLAYQAGRPGSELSLLDQKLVELARALALSPAVLLLDEPVGGLNPRESEALVGHVARLRRSGMGVILVEHDMNVVMNLADRIVVLRTGSVLATGTPREIQQNPEVVAAYLGVRKAGR